MLEENLLTLETTPDDSEAINCVFRAAHTIKGSAGLFGFDQTVAFTHEVETVLMGIRDGDRELDGATITTLIKCGDQLASMIECLSPEGEFIEPDLITKGEQLLQQLGCEITSVATSANISASEAVTVTPGEGGSHYWHISLRFSSEVLRDGMEPIAFIRFLGRLGEIVYIASLDEQLPDWDIYDPEACYLGFEIALDGDTTKADIEDVFEFVRDDLELKILPPRSQTHEFIQLIEKLPESESRLGEILLRCKAITEQELQQALGQQQDGGERLGEILCKDQSTSAPVLNAALKKQSSGTKKVKKERQILRVDTARLDDLINLIGELVISGSNVNMLAEETRNQALMESIETMSHLIEEIRSGCLSLRMVQISQTFSKFQRIVRDISQELGKDIELNINGEETELDKSMVEKISDPLLHLVRNSIDHGIESTEERLAAGKPAKGLIKLSASYDSGYVVIEVADDGRGLNRDKILAKALENGLIDTDQGMSDGDIYRLIFAAGFSTADTVSNLSGRGVGMDVVRRNIEGLRGSIDIDSQQGAGSCMTIRLPLTLAIIDGFLIGIESSRYILPLDSVVECVELAGNGLPYRTRQQLHGFAR